MLIQTLQPVRSPSPHFKKDAQRTRDDSTMSLNIMLAESGQLPQINTNPMDISAMLNPSLNEAELVRHRIENRAHDDRCSDISPTSDRGQQQIYRPSIKSGPFVSAHQQPPSGHHRFAVDLSPPLSPNSACCQQQLFSPTFHHAYPTPPPSSPCNHLPSQVEHHSQSNSTAASQKQYHSTWRQTASLSPGLALTLERPIRDEYCNVPVQVHNIRISHSSSHSSYPQAAPASRRGSRRITKPAKRKSTLPHSNKPYTLEQVHFMRYYREDCGLFWPQVHALFYRHWPNSGRITVACLSSRYYRSNVVPKLDENGEPVLDKNGKVVMITAKVRERGTAEGKNKPFLLVDKHPEFALIYDWVEAEHKRKATRILQGLEEPTEEGEVSGMFPLYILYQRR